MTERQPTLFDKPPALTRRRDPQTSRAAAAAVEPKLGKLKAAMLSVWSTRSATANEAAAICVRQYGGKHESYRKRAKELLDGGLIESAGDPRTCANTGSNAQPFQASTRDK